MSKEHKSKYDPSRDTVGKIYRDIHMNADDTPVLVGDMCTAIMKDLVDDINDAIASKPYGDVPWYIMIHEKKDLQMKDALLRRMLHFRKRPWPEDDTTVFWHDPVACETRFCWSLPHHSEMDNIIFCHNLFEPDLVAEVKAWKAFDLHYFGFTKDDKGDWVPNPRWKDKPLQIKRAKIYSA